MNIDKLSQDYQSEGFCRGCLIKYPNQSDLIQYTEKNRRLFVYSTGLQVKRNDAFTFQLCKDCYVNMKISCKFKKQCRTSDKQFKSYLRLKEISDLDLCTFLKNSNDTLRFPLLSGNSTPANQRNKDDDNESTCTSIQNFMSDILQGAEMPDTEARIIKEVIEEEADLLDDSLDSHWLQDDASIDTDFRLDLSFSPFSTRSVNNDHCYTPSKEIETSRSSNNHVKKVLEQLPTLQNDYSVSPKDISINGINEVLKDICGESQVSLEDDYMQDNLIEECVDGNEERHVIQTDPSMPDLTATDNNFSTQNEIDIAVKIVNKDIAVKIINKDHKKNFYVLNEGIEAVNEGAVDNQLNCAVFDNQVTEPSTMECSIDKKLKKALENNKKEIPLEDLLVSPAQGFPDVSMESLPKEVDFTKDIKSFTPVFEDCTKTNDKKDEYLLTAINTSTPIYNNAPKTNVISTPTVNGFPEGGGASTPMINNILFGEKLELNDSNSGYKIGHHIEKFENVDGYIEALEDIFNDSVKDFDNNKEIKMGDDSILLETEKDNFYDIEDCCCKICNQKYPTLHGLNIHMAKIHKINISETKFGNKNNLLKVCPHCGIAIKDRSNFSKHVRSHGVKDGFQCQICFKTFSTASNLRHHVYIHKTQKAIEDRKNREKMKKEKEKFLCKECGMTFGSSSNWHAHCRRHAAPELACQQCDARFHTQNELLRHERFHTDERSYKCPQPDCDKAFVTSFNLKRHIRTHSDVKPFQCDTCKKTFANKSYIEKHIKTSVICMRKREGIKKTIPLKYTCFFCDKKFATEGRFNKHQYLGCKKKGDQSIIKIQEQSSVPPNIKIKVLSDIRIEQ